MDLNNYEVVGFDGTYLYYVDDKIEEIIVVDSVSETYTTYHDVSCMILNMLDDDPDYEKTYANYEIIGENSELAKLFKMKMDIAFYNFFLMCWHMVAREFLDNLDNDYSEEMKEKYEKILLLEKYDMFCDDDLANYTTVMESYVEGKKLMEEIELLKRDNHSDCLSN